jgi:hypothetical protein
MNKEIIIVLRHSRERTFNICKLIASSQADVVVINERPFSSAIKKTFEVGHQNKSYKYLLALDADVLLTDGAIENIVNYLNKYAIPFQSCGKNWLKVDFKVKDKFRGNAYCGCHAYNNIFSERMYEFTVNSNYENRRRPESSVVSEFKNKHGLYSDNASLKVGIHDYEQWSNDVYVKYYNRGIRDQAYLKKIRAMITEKKISKPEDVDYDIAIMGLDDSIGKTYSEMLFDWEKFPTVIPIEKEPLILCPDVKNFLKK